MTDLPPRRRDRPLDVLGPLALRLAMTPARLAQQRAELRVGAFMLGRPAAHRVVPRRRAPVARLPAPALEQPRDVLEQGEQPLDRPSGPIAAGLARGRLVVDLERLRGELLERVPPAAVVEQLHQPRRRPLPVQRPWRSQHPRQVERRIDAGAEPLARLLPQPPLEPLDELAGPLAILAGTELERMVEQPVRVNAAAGPDQQRRFEHGASDVDRRLKARERAALDLPVAPRRAVDVELGPDRRQRDRVVSAAAALRRRRGDRRDSHVNVDRAEHIAKRILGVSAQSATGRTPRRQSSA